MPLTEGSDAALRAGIDGASDRLMTALRTNAPDSLLALMTDDVVMMPPNEPVLRGKAAVRAWYEGFVAELRTTSLTLADREVFVGGEWAAEVAGFEWTMVPVSGGEAIVDRGSYIQISQREAGGRWLFSREVWNSLGPVTAPSAEQ